MATRASRIFPPNAFPKMLSCTNGKIMDASISAGERKNLRISRSTIAIILFINSDPHGSWLQPRPLRHGEPIRFLQFVAELSPGVMDEDVIQSRVLHRERLDRSPGFDGHLNQFGSSARAVAGQDSIHPRSLVLY